MNAEVTFQNNNVFPLAVGDLQSGRVYESTYGAFYLGMNCKDIAAVQIGGPAIVFTAASMRFREVPAEAVVNLF